MSAGALVVPKEFNVNTNQVQRARLELTKPILVEENLSHEFVRWACLLISASVLVLIIWSSFAKVHEVSRASGSILPAGFERVLQHFEGGIVQTINAKAGEIVNEGDVLFVLDDASTSEDLTTLLGQQANLTAEIAVLTALAEDGEPDLPSFDPSTRRFTDTNINSYSASKQAQSERAGALQSRIDQANNAIAVIDEQIAAADDQFVFANDELARVTILVNAGISAAALRAQRENAVSTARSQQQILGKRRNSAQSDLVEAQRNLSAYLAEMRSEATDQLRELQGSLATVEGELQKRQRRADRQNVVSPVHGIVKEVLVTTVGGTVQAGQSLAVVVPIEEELYADARLPADQVGYVELGQAAQIKVTAYDFTRFGWIDGVVDTISPSTFSDGGPAYFKVRLRLDSLSPKNAPAAQVMPGMEVAVDIITGEKTVLAYLLNPIRKAFGNAFGER